MVYFADDLFHAAVVFKLGDAQAFPAQPGLLKKATHRLRAFVRTKVPFEVSAFTRAAGNQNRTVGAGFKSLEQINQIHLARTGQAYGFPLIAVRPAAALSQGLDVNAVCAVKQV
jgi:hypothetical protein